MPAVEDARPASNKVVSSAVSWNSWPSTSSPFARRTVFAIQLFLFVIRQARSAVARTPFKSVLIVGEGHPGNSLAHRI